MEQMTIPTEKHPLEPFLPQRAKVLMLGSFPPSRKRWSMDFFYPNWINDMWRIMGHVFYGDREHFVWKYPEDGKAVRKFDRERIADFCTEKGIALYDTASEVRRLKDNASDKFLEVVQATDIKALLDRIPECGAIVTTGQKATEVICEVFGCEMPAVGNWTECSFDSIGHPEPLNPGESRVFSQARCTRSLRFWRMPSSSRAYPLPLEKKAEHYRLMFVTEGIIKRTTI